MNTRITALFALIFLFGCSSETTKSKIREVHSITKHVNGNEKLAEAEFELISESPTSFFTYQNLRHDPRSHIVLNLHQSGEPKTYLIGDGFFLIDQGYLLNSSRTKLVATLIEISLKPNYENRYGND